VERGQAGKPVRLVIENENAEMGAIPFLHFEF
jgi:hypothetical protein